MRKRHVFSFFAAGVAAALIAAGAMAQTEEEMAAMMEMAAPGEHHEHLAMLVGDWTYTATFWMPGAPEATKTDGTMSARTLLGGRFVEAVWKGEVGGMPFEGIGIDGYDNRKQVHTSTWLDNMGTQTYHYTGACEKDGKIRTSTGTFTDPMSGETVTENGKVTFRDDGTVLLESWRVGEDDSKTKTMEIVLTRK